MAEIDGVEAIRDNQKLFELTTKFAPVSIAANGSAIAIGGEVSSLLADYRSIM